MAAAPGADEAAAPIPLDQPKPWLQSLLLVSGKRSRRALFSLNDTMRLNVLQLVPRVKLHITPVPSATPASKLAVSPAHVSSLRMAAEHSDDVHLLLELPRCAHTGHAKDCLKALMSEQVLPGVVTLSIHAALAMPRPEETLLEAAAQCPQLKCIQMVNISLYASKHVSSVSPDLSLQHVTSFICDAPPTATVQQLLARQLTNLEITSTESINTSTLFRCSYPALKRFVADGLRLDADSLLAMLQRMPSLTDVHLYSIAADGEDRSSYDCSWRRLTLTTLDLASAPFLPLHNLQRLMVINHLMYLGVEEQVYPMTDTQVAAAKQISVRLQTPRDIPIQLLVNCDLMDAIEVLPPVVAAVGYTLLASTGNLACCINRAQPVSQSLLLALQHVPCTKLVFVECSWEDGALQELLCYLPQVRELYLDGCVDAGALLDMCQQATRPVQVCLSEHAEFCLGTPQECAGVRALIAAGCPLVELVGEDVMLYEVAAAAAELASELREVQPL